MNRDPRLERYLSTLESALKPFPVSDRAEIITEIKSHVYSALERDPQASVESVLAALGEPETVANRYLLERNMKPAKPPISPIVRWMVIGFLGTFAMILLFTGFVISQFSPIVKVDEKSDKVEILGGLVKIDGANERVQIRSILDIKGHEYSGNQGVKEGERIVVKFANGRVDVATNEEANLEWSCRGGKNGQAPEPLSENGVLTLDLTPMQGVRCDLSVPKGAKFELTGSDGRISITDADFDANVDLARGRISFAAAHEIAFKYDVKVDSGKADEFTSSDHPNARIAKLHLGSGRISNDGSGD